MTIKLENISKSYERVQALKNINLELEQGKVYGLVGRNGAGKTTLLKMLSKMLNPDSGRVILSDSTVAYSRSDNSVFSAYSAKVLFKIAREVYPNYNTEYEKELMDAFQPNMKKMHMKLSSGMKNIVNLIIALSANPDVLLLDEPYVGLDPINREILYRFLVDKYFDGEHIVIISSHMITEIEGYFEHAIIIDKGQIIVSDELDAIKKKAVVVSVTEEQKKQLEQKVNVLSVDRIGARYDVYIYDELDLIRDITQESLVTQMNLQTLMVKMLGSREARL